MAQQTQVRRIQIEVDVKGSGDLDSVAKSLGNLNKTSQGLVGTLANLRNAFLGYFAVLKVGQLAELSDTMQLLFDRITILSGSTDKAKDVFKGLLEVANTTRTSIDDLATVYARVAQSSDALGLSQKELLTLTETLQNTFRLSGASTQEAVGSTIQLTQAFSLGKLRGQELRSVLTQNVVVAKLLRQEFGNDIFKKAEKGMVDVNKVAAVLYEHQQEINASAAKLGQTFNQTVTVALNNFKVKLLEINQEFNVSGEFAKGVVFIEDHLTQLTLIVGVLAATAIPALITALASLITTVGVFVASNPITLAFAAIGIAIALSIKNFGELEVVFKNTMASIALAASDFAQRLSFTFSLGGANKKLDDFAENARTVARSFQAEAQAIANNPLARSGGKRSDYIQSKEESDATSKRLRGLKTTGDETEKFKDILAKLNKEFSDGKITQDEYFAKLDSTEPEKFFLQFKEGKIDLEQYKNSLDKLDFTKLKRDLPEINRSYTQGRISLAEYNKEIEENQLRDLTLQAEHGTLAFKDLNEQILKTSDSLSFRTSGYGGAQAYIESIGKIGQQVAAGITTAFGALETGFTDFIKTGKFNFDKFTQSILDDLTKIVVRAAIIAPFANILTQALGPSTPRGTAYTGGDVNPSYGTVAAHGAAFDSGVRKFASGGLVTSPTMFGYGGGKRGLMGEAGTEAILPLSRNSRGDLGVHASTSPVNVTVINNAGVDVETKASTGPSGERTIELMIHKSVREGLSNGSYDKSLQASYGLRRKGS